MDVKTYIKVSAINLAFLAGGILIGFVVERAHTDAIIAHAQAPTAPAKISAASQEPQAEYVAPNIASGSAAFGTLLAGRFAADEAMVQGIDLLKLHQNTLAFLSLKYPTAEIQKIIEDSRVRRPLRLQPPPQPK